MGMGALGGEEEAAQCRGPSARDDRCRWRGREGTVHERRFPEEGTTRGGGLARWTAGLEPEGHRQATGTRYSRYKKSSLPVAARAKKPGFSQPELINKHCRFVAVLCVCVVFSVLGGVLVDDDELHNKNPPRRAFGKSPPAPRKPKGKPGRPFVGARGGGSKRVDSPWVHSPGAEGPG